MTFSDVAVGHVTEIALKAHKFRDVSTLPVTDRRIYVEVPPNGNIVWRYRFATGVYDRR